MTDILILDQIRLSYNAQQDTLQNISFSVRQGEFLSVIGPSGCGKSSLLNIIAGFVQPSDGTVTVEGRAVSRPGPDRGVVFQDLALFPWLSVLENVAFGLKMQGIGKVERLDRSMEAIRLVGLSGNEHSGVAELSGGMRQRVAIARTIVTKPKILLMDEPLSALDAMTREVMQEEILRIHAQTGMTIILITHSMDEAVYMSDRVIVMQTAPGQISHIMQIKMEKPRRPELRVSPLFNEYKMQLMQHLQKGFQMPYEIDGSGI